MTKEKQKTPDDSEASAATSRSSEFQANVEADSAESSERENVQAVVEVHPRRVSFKQSQTQREKKKVSETGRDQSLESEKDHESREFLENGQSKSKDIKGDLRDKGILRNEAVKTKNPTQGNLEIESTGALKSDGSHLNSQTHLEKGTGGEVRQGDLESVNDLESGGFDSNNDTHLKEEIALDTERDALEIEEISGDIPPAGGLNVGTTRDQSERPSQRPRLFSFLLGRFLRHHTERYSRRIKISQERIREWWKESTCRRQLTEEWMYYVFWLIVCCLCVIWAAMVWPNERDVPICIISVIIFCCAATLLCKRECLLDWIGYMSKRLDVMNDSQRLQDEFERVYLKKSKCFDCFSCSSDEYVALPPRRHWYANRRTRMDNRRTRMDNGRTDFEHEVVDVFNPEESAQLRRMVVEEFSESVSSDSPRERRRKKKTKAHPHLTEAAAIRVVDQWICEEFKVTCSVPEGERWPKRLNPYIRYVRHTKKKPESESTPMDEDVFKCEHYGQAVACACAELAEKEKARKAALRKPADDDDFICEVCGNVACTCLEVVEKYKAEVREEDDYVCEQCGNVFDCCICLEVVP